jgi:hypothetical protein
MKDLLTVEEYEVKLKALPKEDEWTEENVKQMVGLYRERLFDITMAETNGYNAEVYVAFARNMINNII